MRGGGIRSSFVHPSIILKRRVGRNNSYFLASCPTGYNYGMMIVVPALAVAINVTANSLSAIRQILVAKCQSKEASSGPSGSARATWRDGWRLDFLRHQLRCPSGIACWSWFEVRSIRLEKRSQALRGRKLGKGYPSLRCAQSASGACRLMPPGAAFLSSLGHRSRCLKNPCGEAAFLRQADP